MNITEFPDMILTKDKLWQSYQDMTLEHRDTVSFIIRTYADIDKVNKNESRERFKIL